MDMHTWSLTTNDAPDNGTEITIETAGPVPDGETEGDETTSVTTILILTPDDVASLHRALSYRPGAPERGQCREEKHIEWPKGEINLARCQLDAGHEAAHEDGDWGWTA